MPLPSSPDSLSQAKRIVHRSKLYGQSVSAAGCSAVPDFDKRPYHASSHKMRNQLQAFVDCVQGMWAGPVHDAGFQATKAKVVLYAGSVKSPCGNAPKNQVSGMYCSSNQTIYLDANGGNAKNAPKYTWTWYLMVAAHEYGHHVQARTGILNAGQDLVSDASGHHRTQLTHKLELQAECFSGMGMRQTAKIDRQRYGQQESRAVGDKEHGSKKNIGRWGLQGYTHQRAAQCGTYNAKSGEVS